MASSRAVRRAGLVAVLAVLSTSTGSAVAARPAPAALGPSVSPCSDLERCDPYASVTPPLVARSDSITCVTDRGPRMQAVLAYPQLSGPPPRELDAALRRQVRLMGEAVRLRSLELGRTRVRLRVECDARGGVTVLRVPVPPDIAVRVSPDTLAPLVRQRAGRAPAEKYVVYYHGRPGRPDVSGEAQGASDDQPGAGNANNRAGTLSVQYQTLPTTAYAGPHWRILLHEYLHSLGAVQLSAPNSDGAGHQTQRYDVMGGSASVEQELSPGCAVFTVDCGADDYFHPRPPSDSYLAESWNVAGPANRWIDRS